MNMIIDSRPIAFTNESNAIQVAPPSDATLFKLKDVESYGTDMLHIKRLYDAEGIRVEYLKVSRE